MEPHCVIETRTGCDVFLPRQTVSKQNSVQEGHITGVCNGAHVDERVVGQSVSHSYPHDRPRLVRFSSLPGHPRRVADVADLDRSTS
jgi:hypothetical protein